MAAAVLYPFPYWTADGALRVSVLCIACQRTFSNVDAAMVHAEAVHPASLQVPEPEAFA